ncbi:MAG: HAD superfamily hydrolase (TIGR01509 family) [Gammaproteobacteria bacterium]|jgi:HAD superfamily hydrolase (TIGR01509 family)
MINWNEIETVMLDMDGTLLDLHFDNYFWQEYLPECWGLLHGMDINSAKVALIPRFKAIEGTLAWYCLDYWSEELGIDILTLKQDVEHLIKTRPYAEELLRKLNNMGKDVVLVTNAHEKILDVKLKKTDIKKYFDHIISAHALGSPKENNAFWESLSNTIAFSQERTLFIDDNLTVLKAAEDYGIRHLLSIAKPDSHLPERSSTEIFHVGDFRELFSA